MCGDRVLMCGEGNGVECVGGDTCSGGIMRYSIYGIYIYIYCLT